MAESRYTKDALRMMATEVLNARDNADPRFMEILFALDFITGLSFQEITRRIEQLAETGECD